MDSSLKKEIGQLGEFNFIARFKPLFDPLIGKNQTGIGDDCAILGKGDERILVTTDMLVEDIHFLRKHILPEQLGYKSLAVNLSDIAAMGGHPVGSFLSLAIPSHTSIEYLDKFMKGYHELSQKYHVPLLGGDTTKSPDRITVNVGIIGMAHASSIRMRSDAKAGDVICVTGNLGDSAAGLQAVLDNADINEITSYLISKHHKPDPKVEEGLSLASMEGVNAMMDISDGLLSDLQHILEASKVSAKIFMEKIPVSPQFNEACKRYKWNRTKLLIETGEDYELLFTVKSDCIDKVRTQYNKYFGKDFYMIGEITEGLPSIKWFDKGKEQAINAHGFDHFKE